MKNLILALLIAGLAGWAVWHFFIREKTLGEKIDDAARSAERSVQKAVDTIKK